MFDPTWGDQDNGRCWSDHGKLIWRTKNRAGPDSKRRNIFYSVTKKQTLETSRYPVDQYRSPSSNHQTGSLRCSHKLLSTLSRQFRDFGTWIFFKKINLSVVSDRECVQLIRIDIDRGGIERFLYKTGRLTSMSRRGSSFSTRIGAKRNKYHPIDVFY